jgi:hypothetical protein
MQRRASSIQQTLLLLACSMRGSPIRNDDKAWIMRAFAGIAVKPVAKTVVKSVRKYKCMSLKLLV